jgi:anti-sigma regulatory factor (Ser/Thr protein kinase)
MNLLRLPFTGAEESASMRSRSAALLAGQPAEVVQDVLLVITELVDNVVQHTDGGGELHMARDDGAVQVEVHDHSRSFPQLQRPDQRRAGGRGLLLVAAIANKWGSRPTATGKVVWAHVTTQPTTPSFTETA